MVEMSFDSNVVVRMTFVIMGAESLGGKGRIRMVARGAEAGRKQEGVQRRKTSRQ